MHGRLPHRPQRRLQAALGSLAVLAVLTIIGGCGGGGGGTESPPATQPAWTEVWAARWAASPRIGITIDHPQPDCKGSTADPEVPLYDGFVGVDPASADWALIGAVEGWSVDGGQLRIDSRQFHGGWAMNSYAAFDPARPLRLSGTVALQPDSGAWLGLALIVDESDYRELALYENAGAGHVGIWAPCHLRPLGAVPAGARRLSLVYTPPPAVTCWRYYVDDQLRYEEACAHDGAPLRGRPRVGLYVVNVRAEVEANNGQVRASVGPLTVETQAAEPR